MAAFHLLFLVLALAFSCNSDVAAAVDDQPLPKQEVFMACSSSSCQEAAERLKRAIGVVNLEAQRCKPIFRAVNRGLESVADDRAKEEALAQAKVQLNRDLGQEGPNALAIDFGYL